MAKRAKGEGSIFVRKDGRIVGQYFVNGKPKSIYGESKQEVRQQLDKAIEKQKNKIDFEKENMTLLQWLDEWLENYVKNSVKRSTLVSYDGIIHTHIAKHKIGKLQLKKLNTKVFQNYVNEKLVSGRADGKPGGLSPKTIANHYNMLHEALDQAVTNGYILKNTIDGIRLPKKEKKEMRVLTRTEQKKLMDAVSKSEKIGACGINLALYTGMRLGEVLGLQWGDVDFENKKIYVRRTLNRLKTYDPESPTATEILIGEPKSENSVRNIPMQEKLIQLLKKQYIGQREIVGMDNSELPGDTFVVTNEALKFYEPKTYQELFEKCVEKSGIKKANFHALRHTFATRCIENGMDVVILSKILGHANPSITMNIYGHALEEQKIASMQKMEEMYEGMVLNL